MKKKNLNIKKVVCKNCGETEERKVLGEFFGTYSGTCFSCKTERSRVVARKSIKNKLSPHWA